MNAYARLQPRCACGGAAAGRCAACARRNMPGLQPKLAVSTPGDRWEREADQAADQVLAAGGRPQLSRLASQPLQREGEDEKKKPPPSPVTEGLSTVASNLGENNPAFSKFTERLGDRFMAQPAPLSIGVPVFLGANYALLWTMALADPAMRRQFDDFNLALLPGIVILSVGQGMSWTAMWIVAGQGVPGPQQVQPGRGWRARWRRRRPLLRGRLPHALWCAAAHQRLPWQAGKRGESVREAGAWCSGLVVRARKAQSRRINDPSGFGRDERNAGHKAQTHGPIMHIWRTMEGRRDAGF